MKSRADKLHGVVAVPLSGICTIFVSLDWVQHLISLIIIFF